MADEEENKRIEEILSKWTRLAVDYGQYDPLMAGSIDGTDTRAHDRAIRRAMTAKYKPISDSSSSSEATIFVGRLSHDTTQERLEEIFIEYGKIRTCKLIRDIITGRSKGYAFIKYKHRRDAEKAYNKAHHTVIDGSTIIVDMELGRTLKGWIPRRLGGGFGGKKESGQLRFGGRDRPFKKPILLNSRQLGRGDGKRGYSNRHRDERERNYRYRSPSPRYRRK